MLYIIRRLASIRIVKALLNTSGIPNYGFTINASHIGDSDLGGTRGKLSIAFLYYFQ